jgi:hypothetical protein
MANNNNNNKTIKNKVTSNHTAQNIYTSAQNLGFRCPDTMR